jgi:DNA-binding NarL/FixJ family response regulator
VLRKINKKHYDDLLRLVKNTNMRKERQILFHQFDVVFLKIFPNFIKDFNALFPDNDQVVLKKNELLNSELRIFGLIRLGITDNEKIAKFLNFSVTTVYTYKTKIKAKSIYKNDFDEKLMAIKAF